MILDSIVISSNYSSDISPQSSSKSQSTAFYHFCRKYPAECHREALLVPSFFINFLNDPAISQNRHARCLLLIANYYLNSSLTYKMTMSTFRIASSKIACVSILKNAKVYFDGRNKSSATVMLEGKEISIKDLSIYNQRSISWESHIQAKLVEARKPFQYLKITIPQNVSPTTSHLSYRLCVHSILLYGSQTWYPSISQKKQLEFLERNFLYWVTGPWDYNLQLSQHIPCPCHFTLYFKI